jgi:alpha/beta superfamily hydrolase
VDAQSVLAVGFVARYAQDPYLAECAVPRIFISSTNDEFASKEQLEQMVAGAPEPKRLVLIAAEDHFFKGALDEFEQAVMANAI